VNDRTLPHSEWQLVTSAVTRRMNDRMLMPSADQQFTSGWNVNPDTQVLRLVGGTLVSVTA